MRMPGLVLGERLQRRVSVTRPDGTVWRFLIQPLRLGFQRRLRVLGLEPPIRPTRVARDSHGKPLKDAQGLAVLMPDEQASAYLQEVELYQQRVAVLLLVEGLASDPDVAFETTPPTVPSGWCDYADAIHSELEIAGFRPGDITWLCDEISRLSGLLPDHVEAVVASFSAGATEADS